VLGRVGEADSQLLPAAGVLMRLVGQVIRVSLDTVDIVKNLPKEFC